jgi:glyoxylase-like metal-dependent hydrolase (beta-lactamase superfamily II)
MATDDLKDKFKLQVIPVTAFQQNAMLFWQTETMNGVLIDPGGDVAKIKKAVQDHGVNITAIWLTHGHIDHAGGAAECRRTWDCEIIGPHPDDQFWLDDLEKMASNYDMEGAENFTPDTYLYEGDTVSLEELTFNILHCPGHSPGSVVLYNEALSFAFVGDVVFQGSIGRTDLPQGNHQQLIESITQKLWPLGKAVQFIPGHGPGSSFGEERENNGFVADSITGYSDE